MSPTDQHLAMGARAALIAILVLAASGSPSQTVAAANGGPAGAQAAAPAWPIVQRRHLVPYPFYLYPGSCFPYGACGSLLWEIRPPRRPEPPPEVASSVEPDIWATSGSPWGYLRRLPPPTPESQIQPRYRDASTIRPEFGDGGGAAAP